MPSQVTGKSKKYTHILQPFGYVMTVVVTTNIPEAVKKAKITGLSKEELEGGSAWTFTDKQNGKCFLFFNPDAKINEIAHESSHVLQNVVTYIGAGYQEREFIAYLYGHIVQIVYEFIEYCKNNVFTS